MAPREYNDIITVIGIPQETDNEDIEHLNNDETTVQPVVNSHVIEGYNDSNVPVEIYFEIAKDFIDTENWNELSKLFQYERNRCILSLDPFLFYLRSAIHNNPSIMMDRQFQTFAWSYCDDLI
jgi:hypothetical protein